ncbi:MAG: PAS domain S-box protein [Nitrospirae bacterium]|nr:PAS domain S-box protein [Nitrospirota bacterium]
MGLIWWRRIDIDLLLIGSVDAFVVGLLVSFIVVVVIIEIRRYDKRSEESVLRAKEEWEQTFDSMADLIMILDKDHRIVKTNRAMAAKLGLTPQETVGLNCYEHVHGKTEPLPSCPHTMLMNDGKEHSAEVYEERLGGYFTVAVSPLYWPSGELKGSVHVARDISERKKAEKDKDTLLQEIHHRVKNNMQVISSLLNIQARSIEDKRLLAIFQDCQSRIKAMALVHEELYQSNNLSKIDIKRYINALLDGLASSLCRKTDIRLKVTVDDIFFNIDTAIPCGLIITELVTNSFKHAFGKREKGEISVELRQNGGIFNLLVRDDGVGLPEGFVPENTASLGLQLVHTLTEQIGGRISITSDSGTEARLVFEEVNT